MRQESDKHKKFAHAEIFLEFLRHIGPTYIHGALRVRFEKSAKFSFTSDAVWPIDFNCDSAIEQEIRSTIEEIFGRLEECSIHLMEIKIDEVHSSEMGFRRAARAATLAVLET